MTNHKPPAIVHFIMSIVVAFTIIAMIKAFAFTDARSLNALGVSATIALGLGVVLLLFAFMGLLRLAAAHAPGTVLPAEEMDANLERGRPRLYSLIVIAAMGLTLVLLSLAGPGGALPPATALVAVVVLLGIATGLTIALWPLLDELPRTMSRETGNAAFYLIVGIGGGWAILAHLGFVPAPTPLDWLTMFTVIMFSASFIAVGRRGLLQSR
jgi:hypothetical protein